MIQRSRFSASLIGLGFALFVSLHPQPNNMGKGGHKEVSIVFYFVSLFLFFVGVSDDTHTHMPREDV